MQMVPTSSEPVLLNTGIDLGEPEREEAQKGEAQMFKRSEHLSLQGKVKGFGAFSGG